MAPTDAEKLRPGDLIYVDQLESHTPGLKPTWKGIPTKSNYAESSLYIDCTKRFMFLTIHESAGTGEAIEGNNRIKRLASSHGFRIK